MEGGDYSKELDVAVKAVHLACSLCQRVQERLSAKETNGAAEHVFSKDDDSPVTVADWGVQATVSWLISRSFSSDNASIVAEEDVDALSKAGSVNLLDDVVGVVNECLDEAPRFSLQKPEKALSSAEVLEAIRRCNATGGPRGRHWVLDPVDGTLGFVRGNQYAVALALIEDGRVVLGVLGCPNYPMNKELLSYHHKSSQNGSLHKNGDLWGKGCVMYARRGSGKALMQPLIRKDMKLQWPYETKLLHVSKVEDPSLATFCESVEKANTNQSFTAGLAHTVGFRNQPLRVYSMVKYAAVARGDAEVFMKFARCGYKEKIWDHAAGVVIVQEAGGVVTDAGGRPLDFSRGIYLEGLDRGIVVCCGSIMHEKLISAVYASWDSSNL